MKTAGLLLFGISLLKVANVTVQDNPQTQIYPKPSNRYHIGTTKKTYSDAATECSCRGMEMITAKTPQEMSNLEYLIADNDLSGAVWLGLTLGQHSNNPADYLWNGLIPISWTNWVTGSPHSDDLNEDKCVLSGTKGWRPRNCNLMRGFICEMSVKSPSLTDNLYFVECSILKPVGLVLRETSTSSWTACAGHCLQELRCDVLYRHTSGICQLYNRDDIRFSKLDKRAEGWVTYNKR